MKKNCAAEIELIAGSNGVFDISLDGKMIYSKSEQKRFPLPDEIIELVKNK